jgi:hypothetical protein
MCAAPWIATASAEGLICSDLDCTEAQFAIKFHPMTVFDRGCVKTQIAMPFGRSSTITLIKRIEYRAICAVEVCAFGKIFEFSHRLDPKPTYALHESGHAT